MLPVIRIAEPEDFSPDALSILRDVGQLDLTPISHEELPRAVETCDVLWIRLAHRLDGQVLRSGIRCRLLAAPVTGLDHIDLQACERLGIEVVSLRGEVDFLREVRATAELSLALALALLRNIPQAAASVRAGTWNRDLFRGTELYGKTAGLVGVGRLGTIVGEYFSALGMHIIGYDPCAEFPPGIERVEDLSTLFAAADLISIHATYGPETRHLVGTRELSRAKSGAVLINTSRGGIVDDDALIAALDSGQLAGAALDVIDGEPDIQPDHPLIAYARAHENLLIVPHIGGNTYESFAKTERFLATRVAERIAAWPAR